jgi:hypothetical protein
MGVWQGVAMDSLKLHRGPPCPTLLRPVSGPPLKWQGGRPSTVFYLFGHPMLYTYVGGRLGWNRIFEFGEKNTLQSL